MNTHSAPSPERDASERALRTLAQGLFVSAAGGIVAALVAGIAPGIQWTVAYWETLGLAVANAAIVACVSYFARKLFPPSQDGA